MPGGPKKLIIDDDHVGQREPLALLRRQGHTVTIAADGDDALDELRRQPVDLVITDVNHPGASHTVICEQVPACLIVSGSPLADVSKGASLSTLMEAVNERTLDLADEKTAEDHHDLCG
jgi:DNA-binding response OmpR family regulator